TALVLTVNQITSGVGPGAKELPSVLALRGRSGDAAAAAFELELPQAAVVDLAVFDLAGREVATLWRGSIAAGRSIHPLRPLDLASGVYFARARVAIAGGEQVRTARAVWLRLAARFGRCHHG